MYRLALTTFSVASALVFAMKSEAQEQPAARARLLDTNGREVGTVRLDEAPSRGVVLRIEVSGLAPGMHAIRIHEAGRCEPPLFASAGARVRHLGEGESAHGRVGRAAESMNFRVPGEGRVEVERLASQATLGAGMNSLFDQDGSAILIYRGPDETASASNVSDRVVCGVIVR